MNHGIFYAVPTPTDTQVAPRMNCDVLYSGIPVDTSKDYSVKKFQTALLGDRTDI